jgi:hypothetical protein
MKATDLTGKRFGHLLVICPSELNGKGERFRWHCQCDCGNSVEVLAQSLKRGATKSCGCMINSAKTKHGMYGTRLYRIWHGMKRRCNVEADEHYKNYGGRGISICNEWNEFEPFMEWALANGYSDKLTIDRINVDGDYCPENCRWVNSLVQQNNRRNNVKLEFNGEIHTQSEWARILGVSCNCLYHRIEKNLPPEKIFSPLMRKRKAAHANS